MNTPGAVLRFRLSRCALLLSLICTAVPAQQAEIPATSEEDVRRIVERAMAAVALAEAQATRSVAEMQIRLIQKDSEIESLRTGLQKSSVSAAEQIRAQAQKAMQQEQVLLAQVEDRSAEAESAVRRAGQLADRVAVLELELDRATKWLAEARQALDRYAAMQDAWSDSMTRLSALLSQARAEKEELQGRMEGYQSRASMLEQSLQSGTADRSAELADRDRAWSETAALMQKRLALSAASLETEKARAHSLSELLAARDRLLAESSPVSMAVAANMEEARVEADGLRAENARLQDKVTALQTRARVIEEAMKSEREKIADEVAVLRLREQLLHESTTSASGEMAQLRAEIGRLEERSAALQNRSKILDESLRTEMLRATTMDSERAALRRMLDEDRAAATVRAEEDRAETARRTEEMRLLRQERDALAASVDEARQERDSAMVALSGNRVEMAESMRVMEESAALLKSLRAERDAALALAAQARTAPVEMRPETHIDQARLAETLRLIGEYEKELAALRIVLLQGAGFALDERAAPPAPSVTIPAPPPVVQPIVSPVPATAASLLQMLNTAPLEELSAIAEIGPTRARAILWYRENVGRLSSEEDLKSVPGFNDERIRILRSWWGPKEEPRP